jgi:L-histidine N-alpha-methyltransferase
MSTCLTTVSEFASDVVEGLSRTEGKRLTPRYFYDDLGSALFEAITLLPEYGLTRADQRLVAAHAGDVAACVGRLCAIAELGSGSGKKSVHILREQKRLNPELIYHPIDVSSAALALCEKEIGELCRVSPVCSDWMDGLQQLNRQRLERQPMLLLFLGSSVGNLDRSTLPEFFQILRSHLHPGDFLLLGADLVKDVDRMITAYDDPTGVTAAFNLNLLGRINRELEADFDLSAFAHEVRWNQDQRRIEMHLLSCRNQEVTCRALDAKFTFRAGETIWTESSHKFTEDELIQLACTAAFRPVTSWIDSEWPFAEVLWEVRHQ